MSDGISGRLGGLFLGYAIAAVVGGLGVFIAARPLVEREIRALVRDTDAELATLASRLGSRELAAIVDTRAAVDGVRGIEYSLRDASGALLAGHLPAVAAPTVDGWLEFELPAAFEGRVSTRPMLGRRTELGAGLQLLVAYDIDRRMAAHAPLVAWLVTGVIATPLLGALIAWLLARRSRRRSDAVTRAINRILSGDLAQRLPRVGRTEVDRLTAEFNAVLDRIESRSATMRAAADSTAHDLRTPLSRLRSAVELAMRREGDPPQLRAALDRVVVEVDRLQMTLDALLRISLAESGSAPLEPVDLSSIIVDVVELYRPLAEEKGQHFECAAETRLALPGNRQLLAQAIANLLDNAIKFTPRGGRVRLSAAERREGVVLEVADSGPGIAPADRGRALERSRRLENAAGKPGSGLGLSLVVAVARLHGAEFVLDDNAPGLCARLVFRNV